MKIKFKQTVFLSNLNSMPIVGEVKDIEDKQAQSLIDAGYAEKVVDETPSKKVVEQEATIEKGEVVKPAPKKRKKPEGEK